MNDDKPIKKSAKSSKAKPVKDTPENIINDSPDDPTVIKMDLSALLQSVLQNEEMQEKIIYEANKQLDSEESIDMVRTILSEYFSSFILLGYDVNGDRKIIKLSNNDRDEDSIIELLRYVMMRILSEE